MPLLLKWILACPCFKVLSVSTLTIKITCHNCNTLNPVTQIIAIKIEKNQLLKANIGSQSRLLLGFICNPIPATVLLLWHNILFFFINIVYSMFITTKLHNHQIKSFNSKNVLNRGNRVAKTHKMNTL